MKRVHNILKNCFPKLKVATIALALTACVLPVSFSHAAPRPRYQSTFTTVSNDEVRVTFGNEQSNASKLSHPKLVVGSISKGSNFHKAGKDAGLSRNDINNIQDIIADKIDLSRLRPGDSFKILFDKSGRSAKINAIEFNTSYHGNIALYRNKDKFYSENEIAQPSSAFKRFPLNGSIKINSQFNPSRKHPVTGQIRPHKGVDFKASIGTPVYAPADGNVYFSGYQRAAGNYIIIEHANGYKTVYMHLSKRFVQQGQKVKIGQVIAQSGNTGRTSGPHLHYEVHVNNKPVDPLKINLPSIPSKKPIFSKKEQQLFAKTVKKYKAELEKELASLSKKNNNVKAD